MALELVCPPPPSTSAVTPPTASSPAVTTAKAEGHQSCTIHIAQATSNLREFVPSQSGSITEANSAALPGSSPRRHWEDLVLLVKVRWPFPLALRVHACGFQPLRHPRSAEERGGNRTGVPLVEGCFSKAASRLCHTADNVLPGPSPELWTATEIGEVRSRF
jgi:hypothetical protein